MTKVERGGWGSKDGEGCVYVDRNAECPMKEEALRDLVSRRGAAQRGMAQRNTPVR